MGAKNAEWLGKQGQSTSATEPTWIAGPARPAANQPTVIATEFQWRIQQSTAEPEPQQSATRHSTHQELQSVAWWAQRWTWALADQSLTSIQSSGSSSSIQPDSSKYWKSLCKGPRKPRLWIETLSLLPGSSNQSDSSPTEARCR